MPRSQRLIAQFKWRAVARQRKSRCLQNFRKTPRGFCFAHEIVDLPPVDARVGDSGYTQVQPKFTLSHRLVGPPAMPLNFKDQIALAGVALLIALLLMPSCLRAQPSGGPYGPIQRTYEVPADAAHVYYVASDGKADAAGTSVAEPTTLEVAIERVVTGDAIILRGGPYRTGNLKFNQQVTIQPYHDERPVLKGAKVATEWEPLQDGLWRTHRPAP